MTAFFCEVVREKRRDLIEDFLSKTKNPRLRPNGTSAFAGAPADESLGKLTDLSCELKAGRDLHR
jgi:hypothetical protein